MTTHFSRVAKCAVVAVFLAVACVSLHAAEGTRVLAVLTVGMTVSNLDASVRFYSDVLDFEEVARNEIATESYSRLEGVQDAHVRTAQLKLGDEVVELTEYESPRGNPVPTDSRSNDLWFQHIAIVVSDMAKAYERLQKHDVSFVSLGYQVLPAWNKQAGGIEACYFRDPDGHVLEIIRFPEGKGAEKWHVASQRLFLGIDHTAIAVSDTAESLRLYRDVLELSIAGESENYGIEQERLSAVFGARVHITSLRPPAGPSVEFLEYLSPSDGRPMPRTVRANDLVHWQVTMAVHDVEKAARAVREAGGRWVSPAGVDVSETGVGFREGAVVRDRDGHAIRLVEP